MAPGLRAGLALLAAATGVAVAVALLPATPTPALKPPAVASGLDAQAPAPAPTADGAAPQGAVAAAVVRAPTARIGSFDCARLAVEVSLDNSRSRQDVTYGYGVAFQRPLRAPYSGADDTSRQRVAAGATKVVVLPLRDDARTVATVYLPDGGHVIAAGSCGQAPAASFALVDCDKVRRGLTLDNTHSRARTRYRWTVTDPAGAVRSGTVDVAAGDLVRTSVPLVDRTRVRVGVTVVGGGPVATSDWRTCGASVLDPRASIGAVDCRDLSAPVFLDNSRTTSRVRFDLPGRDDVLLGPGETRTFRLHLPVAGRLAVRAEAVREDGSGLDLAVVSTTPCAATPTDVGTSPATAADPG